MSLGRHGLGLGEALCRAALKPQNCQGHKLKPLPRVPAPLPTDWGRGCPQLLQNEAGLPGFSRAEAGPTRCSPSLLPRAWSGAWHAWECLLGLLSTVLAGLFSLHQPGLWMKQHGACPCLSHLLREGLDS